MAARNEGAADVECERTATWRALSKRQSATCAQHIGDGGAMWAVIFLQGSTYQEAAFEAALLPLLLLQVAHAGAHPRLRLSTATLRHPRAWQSRGSNYASFHDLINALKRASRPVKVPGLPCRRHHC